jgi:hypothetical protein
MKNPSTQKRSEKAFVYGTALWFICKNGTTIDKILACITDSLKQALSLTQAEESTKRHRRPLQRLSFAWLATISNQGRSMIQK